MRSIDEAVAGGGTENRTDQRQSNCSDKASRSSTRAFVVVGEGTEASWAGGHVRFEGHGNTRSKVTRSDSNERDRHAFRVTCPAARSLLVRPAGAASAPFGFLWRFCFVVSMKDSIVSRRCC